MGSRRKFIKDAALASGMAIGLPQLLKGNAGGPILPEKKPVVISTWPHGMAANDAAWKVLSAAGRALDAVEQGVMVSEADPKVDSVGYGGLPDRDGKVTLDACIMDENGNCGSVAFVQNFMHPISIARKVMENTPHVMLVGEGAEQFALGNGFKKQDLLTPEAKAKWLEWKKNNSMKKIDKKNHDTIGMVAIDSKGNLSGACTTSGLAWKLHGRVGDSPIIGAGLYVDNEVGGAAATGKGEAVIKIAGSAMIVEMMRNGKSPREACEEAVRRIARKQNDYKTFQVGFIAVNKAGETGAFSLQKGFQYALYQEGANKLFDAEYLVK